MHSIAEDFPKNLSFILILGACDYRTLTACNHLNITNYNIRCISVPQTHSQRGLKICVWLWQGVDTLIPGHLQHTAANIDAELQHTAVKSHVRCDPSLHANKYFLQLLHISTNKYNNKSSHQPLMAWDYLLSINFIPVIIIVGLFLTQLTQLRSVDKDINEFLSLQICWNLPLLLSFSHIFFWTFFLVSLCPSEPEPSETRGWGHKDP